MIIDVRISYNSTTREWSFTNVNTEGNIEINIGDLILFRSGDGKEYTVIIGAVDQYFDTDNENYNFVVNPFNLTITDPSDTETTAPHIDTQIWVKSDGRTIKCYAPPKIIIHV